MNKYKYNLNFRLEKRKDATGDLILNADITFGGKRIFFFTGYRVGSNQWNKDTQKMKRNNFNANGDSASDVNARLDKIRVAVGNVFSILERDDIAPTPQTVRECLKRVLNEERSTRLSVAECYKLLIEERENELKERPETAQWTKGTLTKHKTMLRHLIDFRGQLYFEDITDDLLAKFEVFLIGKGLSNNYVYKSMKDIKTFLNWAARKGYNKNEAYKSYQQRFKDETKDSDGQNLFALNEDEIQSIIDFKTDRQAIDRTRDIFIVSCFIGQRFSDVINLKWCDVHTTEKGEMYFDIVQQKTNKRVQVTPNKIVEAIISKYPKLDDSETVFPKISNQKYNEHLKELGRLVGLTGEWVRISQCGNEKKREVFKKYECLSSHVARRTYVTLAMSMGASSEQICAVTGHSSKKMMQVYVKMGITAKKNWANRMGEMFNYDSAPTNNTLDDQPNFPISDYSEQENPTGNFNRELREKLSPMLSEDAEIREFQLQVLNDDVIDLKKFGLLSPEKRKAVSDFMAIAFNELSAIKAHNEE